MHERHRLVIRGSRVIAAAALAALVLLPARSQGSSPEWSVPLEYQVTGLASLSQFGDDFGGAELQGSFSIFSVGLLLGLRYERVRVPHQPDGVLYQGAGVDLGFQLRPLHWVYDTKAARWFDPHATVGGFIGGLGERGFASFGYFGMGADVCVLPFEPLGNLNDYDRNKLAQRQIALTVQYRYVFNPLSNDEGPRMYDVQRSAASHELLVGVAYRVFN